MVLTIREATEADFDRIATLFLEELHFHAALLPERYQITDTIITDSWFRRVILSQREVLFVAEQGEDLLGLVLARLLANPQDPIYQPRRYVYVDELAVTTQHRRTGIGKRLMKRVHQWAEEQGVTEVELNVWERNTGAINFYEQLGYTTVRRTMRTQL